METATTTPAAAEPSPTKRSGVEVLKETSRHLRGTIVTELNDGTDHVSKDSYNLLKFHGTYQQEDRDARKTRDKTGIGKHYMFMVRCKIPGGKVSADQYLGMDGLAGQYANGTLRITTRQGIQFHGVLKRDLHATIAGINATLLTTLGACGDVERNVMCCPAPICDGLHDQLQEAADLIAAHLAPRSKAYFEMWLNGKPVEEKPGDTDFEPIYGKTYLPRKFKTGLTLPFDNCIDIYAQDLGFVANIETGKIAGYNVLVGGGMGMTNGNPNTFPYLGKPICYVPAAALLNAAEAVVKLYRDHGNRADRKRARIKYVLNDWGVPKFRDVLASYVGGALADPKPIQIHDLDPHLGLHPQGDGKWFYGISVENGRIKDEGSFRLRTALRMLVERLRPSLRLTPLQDVLLCDLQGAAKEEIERTLAEHGVLRPEQLSTVQKLSMACPAIPTCGLALSESERALPGIIDQLEVELKRLGLEDEKISVRMTGCPNGCARPYQSDIGLVGRSGDKYTLYVGGRLLGDRLNFVLKDLVPLAQILPTLVSLLEAFKKDRHPGEGFGDFCQRLGAEALQALIPQPRPDREKESATMTKAIASRLATATPAENGVTREVLPQPAGTREAAQEPAARPAPRPSSETYFAGATGLEVRDYSYLLNDDGSIRQTAVCFYAGELRAAQTGGQAPFGREAVYLGQADPNRLYRARKLSDTFYAGSPGRERVDYRLFYAADGSVERTVVFHYGDSLRAKDAQAGEPLRRQVTYEGAPPL